MTETYIVDRKDKDTEDRYTIQFFDKDDLQGIDHLNKSLTLLFFDCLLTFPLLCPFLALSFFLPLILIETI